MVTRPNSGPPMESATAGGGDNPKFSSITSVIPSVKDKKKNTAGDLGKGIVRSAKGKVEFTVLLVGETGTGKTAMLRLLANVWDGRSPSDYKDFHDQSNEAGGGTNHSQTNSAKLYEFVNSKGVTIRILDTPGLVDTRGLHQDKRHLASIADAIRTQVATIDAVIILANGTQSRLGIATDYALTTLSAMFPKSLAQNIGFVFTNVWDRLAVNFDVTSLPQVLQKNKRFLINNPVALKENYTRYTREREQEDDSSSEDEASEEDSDRLISDAHSKALNALAHIFNWIDSLDPQPTTDIVKLYDQLQAIDEQITAALAAMDEAVTKRQELGEIKKKLEEVVKKELDEIKQKLSDGATKRELGEVQQKLVMAKMIMEQYQEYERIITRKVHRRFPTPEHNTLCVAPHCYSNCHKSCSLPFSVRPAKLWRCSAFIRWRPPFDQCISCGHSRDFHRHFKSSWVEVDDELVPIDQEAQKTYQDGATDKEGEENLMNQVDDGIARLTEGLQDITDRISDLIQEYTKLSLTGSFRGQVQKTILLLEENHKQMTSNSASKPVDPAIIHSITKNIEYMKRRLEVIDKVSEEDSRYHLSRFEKGMTN